MQTILLLAACMMAWGLAVFLMKVAGQKLGPYTSAVFALPGYLAVGLLAAGRAEYHLSPRHAAAFAVGALYMVGNMAFFKLCETGDVSRLVPITSVYVIIPVALGWLLLHEPVTVRRAIGLLLAALALYLLTAPERGPSA